METSKILIVEDEARMLNSIRLLLSDRKYDIHAATSGLAALEKIADISFDLILLDLFLGDMNGYQVMDHTHIYAPDALVIIITGNASIESAVEALKRGAYSYLKKPFEAEELMKATENALAHKNLLCEQKRVARALRESEEQFRELVESSPIGISIIQHDRIIYQNPQQKKTFADLLPYCFTENYNGVHPDDVPKVRDAYHRLQSGQTKIVEAEFRFFPGGDAGIRADMKWLQCRASSYTYHGEAAFLLNTIDVTQAKEFERLLSIKSKMVSLGRVAAGIAHEIRNPLTGINSYLYSLNDLCNIEQPDIEDMDVMRRIVSQVQIASNKIENVIKKVLDFSKPGMPQKHLVTVNKAVEEAVGLSAAALRRSGIRMEKSLSPDLPLCYADPQLIEQVILNLINNAAQSMEEVDGEKIVEISSYSDNASVNITVADSGPGVPQELHGDIFDPFFTTKSEGSGIGLSIAQRIVLDHNGAISIGVSKWGGAAFRVELPIE